ncbi:Protein of unknown function DUF761, plant [Dillenia turbinata]|uniref:Uncharacterized protein n=1 Tax=Dillenia turbinata TaxID=194707 RepID=A0AAN8UPX6_9MAGN
MSDPKTYRKTRHPIPDLNSPTQDIPIKSSNFYRDFICKSVTVLFVLVLLTLFPSQTPDFISLTIPNRSWELLHLLFVGIAVCYGIFSWRNDDINFESHTHSKYDNTQTYLSRIFQVSTNSDDGFEIAFGFDEKNVIPTWNSRSLYNESVVARKNASFEHSDDKPLGLPVRSLRKSIIVNGGDLDLNVFSSSERFGNIRNGRIGDLGVDLEEELSKTGGVPSPVPWSSRTGMMEFNEEVGGFSFNSNSPSSMESEFNQLKSGSFQAPPTFASPNSSKSSSPHTASPNLQGSRFEDLSKTSRINGPEEACGFGSSMRYHSNSNLESESHLLKSYSFRSPLTFSTTNSNSTSPHKTSPSFRESVFESYSRKNRFNGSCVLGSSASTTQNSSSAFNSSQFGDGSFLENKPRRSNEGSLKMSGMEKEENLQAKTLGSSKSDEKIPPDLVKSVSRGKSVRTIRGSVQVGKVPSESEAASIENDGRRQNVDKHFHMQQQTNGRNQKQDKSDGFMDSEESGSEVDNMQVSSDSNSEKHIHDQEDDGNDEDEVTSTPISSAVPEAYEVDKKAGEFIAKFKEQIRLQKLASMEGSQRQHARRNSYW